MRRQAEEHLQEIVGQPLSEKAALDLAALESARSKKH
jgi:hypothetical protein